MTDQFVQVGARMPEAPRVSICVLALGSVDRLRSCLASLRRNVDPSLAEVIVVANQMTPAEAERVGQHDDVLLLVSETNLGFGGGNNYGMSRARGEYLVLLNDDSVVRERWLENLLLTADADPSIGAVGSRIESPDGTLQEAGSVLWRDGLASHIGEGLSVGSTRYQYRRDVDYISANGLMISKVAWDAAGGFDCRFHPAYYEDVDLCMGLRNGGRRVVYEPRAVITHDASQSTTNLFRRYLLERNRRQCAEKWREEMQGLGLLGGDKALAIERAIRRVRGNPLAVLVAVERCAEEDVNDAAPWRAVDRLASAGWAVTLAVTHGSARNLSCRLDRSGAMDAVIDRGIEIRFGPMASFWTENRTAFDAMIASESVAMTAPDDQPRPAVVGSDGWDAVVEELLATRPHAAPAAAEATRVPSPSKPIRKARRRTERSVLDGDSAARLQRSLESATAELSVKDAYIAKLEGDVVSMRADRERLPQTKAKRVLQRAMGRDRWSALSTTLKESGSTSAAPGTRSQGVAPVRRTVPSAGPRTADVSSPWLLVMGMHRSGTSAVTGALGRLGLEVPAEEDWLDPDESNPDHFESRSMMLLDEKLLRLFGGSWDSPPQLPAGWSDSPDVRALDGEARAAVARAFPGGGPAAVKDPRVCFCLPFWQRVANVPMAAVFVWRSPLAVARSLEKRNGFNPLLGVALWERYNAAALEAMAGMDVFVTSYERMLGDPEASCGEVAKWLDTLEPWRQLGRTWRVEDAAAAFVGDRRHQYDEDVSPLLESQRKLLEILRDLDGRSTGFETPALPSPSPWASALVQAHHFENVADRARREADGMRESVSWRMTAPIRTASSRVRPKPPS